MVILLKENISLRLAYIVRGLVYHHGGKHGSTQAVMVLEKEPRVLHLDQQPAGKENHQARLRHVKPKSPSLVAHFFLQSHTYSSKDITANATHSLSLTSESPGVIPTHTPHSGSSTWSSVPQESEPASPTEGSLSLPVWIMYSFYCIAH